MRQNRVLLPLHGRNLHPRRTSVGDRKVWSLFCRSATLALFRLLEFHDRIFAVSMKNITVAFGFASIAASQLVLGLWMIDLAVKNGRE